MSHPSPRPSSLRRVGLYPDAPPTPTPTPSRKGLFLSFFFWVLFLHPVDSEPTVCSLGFVCSSLLSPGVFYALLVDLLQRRSPDHNQRGGSADAPVGLELEMETLALLFHSLWILQCNTVSADSIIHIGKRRSGAAWWGSPQTGSAGRLAAYQVELELVWNSGATRQLITIPCQNLGGGGGVQAVAFRPGRAQRSLAQVHPQSVAPRHPSTPPPLHLSSLHPSLPPGACSHACSSSPEAGSRKQPDVGVWWAFRFIHQSSLSPPPPPSPSPPPPPNAPPPPPLPRVPSSMSLNFQSDVSEM